MDALVLASPAAIIEDPWMPRPEEMASVLYAHPERQANTAALPPDVDAKSARRVRGAGRAA